MALKKITNKKCLLASNELNFCYNATTKKNITNRFRFLIIKLCDSLLVNKLKIKDLLQTNKFCRGHFINP